MIGDPAPRTQNTGVSVVVPFYNSEAHIERCITALLSQRYPADLCEIIFVDNGSPDASREIVQRYPGIRLLSESKRGSYAARNRAVAGSTGSIIAFTDADCAPAPDWLQAIVTVLGDPGIQIVLGSVSSRRSGALALLDAYEDERGAYVFSATAPELYYGYTNNMAVRRAAFETVGPFREVSRGGDVVLVRRAVDVYAVDAVRYAPQVSVEHLEITSPWVWYRKMFTYGRTTRTYRPIVSTRPMTPGERLEVFRRTVQRHGYSLATSALLFVLLALGVGAHLLGRWTFIGPRSQKRPRLTDPTP
jgi:glycosyltransferase involved in cell wall biosynthesis